MPTLKCSSIPLQITGSRMAARPCRTARVRLASDSFVKGLRVSDSRHTSSTRQRGVTMVASARFEAWVKGPFSHRALLTLEEKGVSYEKHYVDFSNKPAWLFEINSKGSVPAIKDLEADKWLTDSGEFADYLEDKIPQPTLGKSDTIPKIGSQIFPTFVKYLKAEGDEAKLLKDTLTKEFEGLSNHLKANGPFLRGNSISAGDLALGPKLYHAVVALKHFKAFELPADCKAVHDYLSKLQSRESWKHTKYSEDLVNAGWKAHLEG